jgi:hypothetical protein
MAVGVDVKYGDTGSFYGFPFAWTGGGILIEGQVKVGENVEYV